MLGIGLNHEAHQGLSYIKVWSIQIFKSVFLLNESTFEEKLTFDLLTLVHMSMDEGRHAYFKTLNGKSIGSSDLKL